MEKRMWLVEIRKDRMKTVITSAIQEDKIDVNPPHNMKI